jgi:hypothetical protein
VLVLIHMLALLIVKTVHYLRLVALFCSSTMKAIWSVPSKIQAIWRIDWIGLVMMTILGYTIAH